MFFPAHHPYIQSGARPPAQPPTLNGYPKGYPKWSGPSLAKTHMKGTLRGQTRPYLKYQTGSAPNGVPPQSLECQGLRSKRAPLPTGSAPKGAPLRCSWQRGTPCFQQSDTLQYLTALTKVHRGTTSATSHFWT